MKPTEEVLPWVTPSKSANRISLTVSALSNPFCAHFSRSPLASWSSLFSSLLARRPRLGAGLFIGPPFPAPAVLCAWDTATFNKGDILPLCAKHSCPNRGANWVLKRKLLSGFPIVPETSSELQR
jgi:hypothetical protein